MSRESSRDRPRQGQCRWKAVVYEPGKLEGYDEHFVACVFPCHATKVSARSVYFRCNDLPYIAGFDFWWNLHQSRRAAERAARAAMRAAAQKKEGE